MSSSVPFTWVGECQMGRGRSFSWKDLLESYGGTCYRLGERERTPREECAFLFSPRIAVNLAPLCTCTCTCIRTCICTCRSRKRKGKRKEKARGSIPHLGRMFERQDPVEMMMCFQLLFHILLHHLHHHYHQVHHYHVHGNGKLPNMQDVHREQHPTFPISVIHTMPFPLSLSLDTS